MHGRMKERTNYRSERGRLEALPWEERYFKRERERKGGREGERERGRERERERENVSRAGNVTFVSEQEVGAGSWTDEPDIKFSLKSRTIFL